jgi:thiol-disulfide isomerase/thioredoxin
MMRLRHVCLSLVSVASLLTAATFSSPADSNLWGKFETTVQGSQVLHQEFELTRRVTTGYAESFSHHQITLDISQGKWRQEFMGLEEDRTRIYDGQQLYEVDPQGTEYARLSSKAKDEVLPAPYDTKIDWRKAKEIQTLPCGFSSKDRPCVIIEAPIKPWVRPGTPGNQITMKDGTAKVMIDTETGGWLRCQIVATVEGDSTSQWVLTYNIKQMSQGASPDASLFKLPDNLHEVKEFARWDENRIRKELGGKSAPDLQITDIQGNPISLAKLQGRTVLLDFWTTWCPPCQSDASSLEKLNQKYGKGNLAIIGISVNEDREIVEKYLKKHPHSYPVVLSSENQIPRAYRISVFPTYLIISPDGTLISAQQGDQGFGKLRKDLEKAGMSIE